MKRSRETKVSVIIPTYQEGRYIDALLSKLKEMNYPLEIIVVDSGSADRTAEKARRYTDKVYVINQRGISKAKNYGANRSSGEILIFLDADVTPPLELAEKTVRTFEDKRVVGATCSIMPANARTSERAFFIFYNRLLRFCALFKPHSRGEFLAVRRQPFFEIGGFDETLPCLEDHDLAFRISKLGKFVFISDLQILESMRRMRKSGLHNVLKSWVANYISYVLFGKTVSRTWSPVR
ncbi:hypothetical protein B6U79_04245 [Candidatus Bathyarchaeota archaeon ex4484_231]|nr:MAG: hypothetical protein B6U79_04245 [Candidatus Bathyarchaeota archaeon ex4484_231]